MQCEWARCECESGHFRTIPNSKLMLIVPLHSPSVRGFAQLSFYFFPVLQLKSGIIWKCPCWSIYFYYMDGLKVKSMSFIRWPLALVLLLPFWTAHEWNVVLSFNETVFIVSGSFVSVVLIYNKTLFEGGFIFHSTKFLMIFNN